MNQESNQFGLPAFCAAAGVSVGHPFTPDYLTINFTIMQHHLQHQATPCSIAMTGIWRILSMCVCRVAVCAACHLDSSEEA